MKKPRRTPAGLGIASRSLRRQRTHPSGPPVGRPFSVTLRFESSPFTARTLAVSAVRVKPRRRARPAGHAGVLPRRDAQRPEPLAVPRRREPELAAKESAEEARVLVPDLERDLLDGRLARLEQVLRLLEPERLHVLERGHARRAREAPLERALGEAGQRRHRRDGRAFLVILRDPFLALR